MEIKTESPSVFNVVDYPIIIDGQIARFNRTGLDSYEVAGFSYKRYRQFPNNAGLLELMSDINLKNASVLEIGVYAGEGTQTILDSRKVSKIYCVDPWKPPEKFALPEAVFDCCLSRDERVVKIKGTIDDFISQYSNCSVDLIYIDGKHLYNDTKYIIETALSKLNPSIIAGHDYIEKFPGVIKAVNELLGKPDKIYRDGSYMISPPV